MKPARALATIALLAFSCDYGDTTDATLPANALEACDLACSRVTALTCADPLPALLSQTCEECDGLRMDAPAEQCAPLVKLYYECLGKQGNARCDGYQDVCAVRADAKQACLDGRPPSSGVCPDDFPVDCGTGFCCPASHPVCRTGGLCGLSVDGGAAGAGS